MQAAVLWTGGKDSALALYRTVQDRVPLTLLATFVPAGEVRFGAHPIDQMARQASQLGLPHHTFVVTQPYDDGYLTALGQIKSSFGVDTIVTGDIDYVNGRPNWIAECGAKVGLNVRLPLWHESREALLREVMERGITARISWIKDEMLPASWLNRIIDDRFIADIVKLHSQTGIDICGENGEYHTMCERLPPLARIRNRM